ncbi:MAG: DUF928 domain-containing protein [Methylococcaceae bacterium]
MNKKFILLVIFISSLSSFASAEGLLTYKPPQINAPQTRIGGGTRNLNLATPKIQVLAPKHTALTSQSQPVLYWYLYEAAQQKVDFILIEEGADEPLLEKSLSLTTAGLNRIHLADYDVVLQAGKKYKWSISDAEHCLEDTSATLIYQSPAIPLSTVEQKAEAGYWYDALQQLIETHSSRVDNLLKQIDLTIPVL